MSTPLSPMPVQETAFLPNQSAMHKVRRPRKSPVVAYSRRRLPLVSLRPSGRYPPILGPDLLHPRPPPPPPPPHAAPILGTFFTAGTRLPLFCGALCGAWDGVRRDQPPTSRPGGGSIPSA